MTTLRIPSPIADRMNVSAQPKISPFRYPGGKTRLVELVHTWLMYNGETETFLEPFAGGASVGLYVATKGLAKTVRLVEIDPDISAFWITVLSDDWRWLCRRIACFEPTRRSIKEILSKEFTSTRDIAFKTLVRNRFGRSGLLWNGAGLVRVGERGAGLWSRWYPSTLIARIKHIHSLRDRLIFVHGCGLEEIRKFSFKKKTAMFVDPPYTVGEKSAGTRLYRYNELDHKLLMDLLANARSKFLLTHEDNRSIRKMADESGMQVIKLPLITGQNKKSAELLIGYDLDTLVTRLREDRKYLIEPLSRFRLV